MEYYTEIEKSKFVSIINADTLYSDDRQYNLLLIKTLVFQNDDVFISDDHQYICIDVLKKMIQQMDYIFPIKLYFHILKMIRFVV